MEKGQNPEHQYIGLVEGLACSLAQRHQRAISDRQEQSDQHGKQHHEKRLIAGRLRRFVALTKHGKILGITLVKCDRYLRSGKVHGGMF